MYVKETTEDTAKVVLGNEVVEMIKPKSFTWRADLVVIAMGI